MTMDQTQDKINSDDGRPVSSTEAALTSQIELCIAGAMIIINSPSMADQPESDALKGVFNAIVRNAEALILADRAQAEEGKACLRS